MNKQKKSNKNNKKQARIEKLIDFEKIFSADREYWENRYKNKGTSGKGSYGKYGNYKAEIINNYIKKYNIETISDFGCGDGNITNLLRGFKNYFGFDVSKKAIDICTNKFRNNTKMKFYTNVIKVPDSDMCFSLDVLYHVTDKKEFEKYLFYLFNKTKKYVLIFFNQYWSFFICKKKKREYSYCSS